MVLPSSQPQQSLSQLNRSLPDSQHTVIYVSDSSDNVVYAYALNNLAQPTKIITRQVSGPQGLATDYMRQLYVTNEGNLAQDVTVYRPGKSGPKIKYPSQYFSGPNAVATGRDGAVYVSNYFNGTVVEFAPGSLSPSRTITLPGTPSQPAGPQGLALDASNNLYVAYNDYFANAGHVERYPSGSSSGSDLGITLSNAGGIAIDGTNNIVVVDRGNDVVDVFHAGSTTPSKAIGPFGSPNQLAFVKGFKRLIVTDEGARQVDVLSYPRGRMLSQSPVYNYTPIGVAVAPAAAK